MIEATYLQRIEMVQVTILTDPWMALVTAER